MSYSVSCECGTVIHVAANAAGTVQLCACGKKVVVPSLRELRQSVGESVTRTPELVIAGLLQTGKLPEGPSCAVCGTVTEGVVQIDVVCEQSAAVKSLWLNSFWNLFLFVLFPIIFLFHWIMTRKDEDRTVGESVVLQVPLRVCVSCAPRLRRNQLKSLFRKVAAYDELLKKYPLAKFSIVKS
ncbi:MAG: hypothetical protein ACRCZF_06040 [Gemmataceae bacterium]